MPKLNFQNVTKRFGTTEVIADFNAEVPDKEFLVLLGPSGCGKSTMLRMIAGLTDVSDGQILFDDKLMNDLEPRERDIAFVFQSYALYPNMTVRENIAFPLLMDRFRWWYHLPVLAGVMRRRIAKSPELSERVDDVARTLELSDYVDRRPRALSGGQRQRVALARSLVRDPEVYLLDEPLSNLDAKLRGQMRTEITTLYRRVGKTFVYVTHDQVEAMTMATRVIVLDHGRIQQIGTPEEIYDAPANTFVARFIGSPGMNLIPVNVVRGEFTASGTPLQVRRSAVADGDYLLGVRPENVTIGQPAEGGLAASVATVEQLGGETLIGLTTGEETGDRLVYARMAVSRQWSAGDRCTVQVDPESALLFDHNTGDRIAVPIMTEGVK